MLRRKQLYGNQFLFEYGVNIAIAFLMLSFPPLTERFVFAKLLFTLRLLLFHRQFLPRNTALSILQGRCVIYRTHCLIRHRFSLNDTN